MKDEESSEEEPIAVKLEPTEVAVNRNYQPEKTTEATKKGTSSIEYVLLNDELNPLQSTVQRDSKKRDVCDIFGEYIAEELRRHDDRTRMILQHKIHNLLYQAVVNPQNLSAQ